jgi:hypothetical protein
MSSNELTKMRAELPADYMRIFMPAFGFRVAISLTVAASFRVSTVTALHHWRH